MRHYYVNKAYRNAFLAGADFPSFSRLTLFAITTPNFIHPSIMAASVVHKNTNVSFAPLDAFPPTFITFGTLEAILHHPCFPFAFQDITQHTQSLIM